MSTNPAAFTDDEPRFRDIIARAERAAREIRIYRRTPCRKCGALMETRERPGSLNVLATCDNPACSLHGFTFDEAGYEAKDLSQYPGMAASA